MSLSSPDGFVQNAWITCEIQIHAKRHNSGTTGRGHLSSSCEEVLDTTEFVNWTVRFWEKKKLEEQHAQNRETLVNHPHRVHLNKKIGSQSYRPLADAQDDNPGLEIVLTDVVLLRNVPNNKMMKIYGPDFTQGFAWARDEGRLSVLEIHSAHCTKQSSSKHCLVLRNALLFRAIWQIWMMPRIESEIATRRCLSGRPPTPIRTTWIRITGVTPRACIWTSPSFVSDRVACILELQIEDCPARLDTRIDGGTTINLAILLKTDFSNSMCAWSCLVQMHARGRHCYLPQDWIILFEFEFCRMLQNNTSSRQIPCRERQKQSLNSSISQQNLVPQLQSDIWHDVYVDDWTMAVMSMVTEGPTWSTSRYPSTAQK